MSNHALILLCAIFLSANAAIGEDIPFVFNERSSGASDFSSARIESMRSSTSDVSELPPISNPADSDILEFPVTGGGNAPDSKTEKKVGELKETFNSRVEPENSHVHEKAIVLLANSPGDYTIDQICSIYDFLKEGWRYVRDPRGVDYFMYANESLRVGEKASCVGAGDCDDFAILMSALIESVGGTTRIILAHNNSTGGHAFTEVYIGQLDSQNSHVEEVLEWLRKNLNIDDIYTHVDTETKEVWLNLDWGADERGYAHPGGPIFRGDRYINLNVRDRYAKTPLNLPESPTASSAQPQSTVQEKTSYQQPELSSAVSVAPIQVSPGQAIPPGAGPLDWYTNKR